MVGILGFITLFTIFYISKIFNHTYNIGERVYILKYKPKHPMFLHVSF